MYLVQFCHYQRMPENAFLPNTKTKIQDLHRSLVENLGNTKIQDPRFPQDSWILDLGISKILARSLVGILDLGSWYFQDFSQDFCANLGSWSWYWAGMHSECIERILTAFLPKWTNKSCNLRAQKRKKYMVHQKN